MQSAIAKDKGIDKKDVTPQMMIEFKKAVTRVLTPHASAILLDPEYGLPAAKARAKNAGLLLAYEKTGYDNNTPGRLPDLLDLWSVRRLVAAGADCVKILLYYTPFDPRRRQRDQARLGGAHRRGMPGARRAVFPRIRGLRGRRGRKGHRIRPQEARHRHPEHGRILEAAIWRGHSEGRSSGEHGFRKGQRVNKGESAYTREEAKDHFQKAAAAAKKPFIYLSAGVSNETFIESLELAAEAGTNFSGVLCGRATWKEGMPVYAKQGLKALEDWLNTQGVANIKNVNKRLKAAKPWHSFYGATSSSMA